MLFVDFKYYLPVNVICKWYLWVVSKRLFIPGYASIDGESEVLLSIENMDVAGSIWNILRCTTLKPQLGNEIVYILPIFSGGGVFIFLQVWVIHLLHSRQQYFW